MKSVKRFNGLNGATVSRGYIGKLLDLAKKENQIDIVYRLSKLLLNNADEYFTIEVINYPLESIGIQYKGSYKVALDDSGCLRSGFRFENGIVVKGQKLARKKTVKPKVIAKRPVVTTTAKKINGQTMAKKPLALNGVDETIISTDSFKKMTVTQLRKYTLDFYKNNLKGKKIAIENYLKEVVFVSGAGRKLLKPIYSEKVAVIQHLESLIKSSAYNNWGDRKKTDSPNIIGYLNFKSKITIDGVKRHIRISITVDENRKTNFKSAEVGKIKKSGNSHEVRFRNPIDGGNKPLHENKNTKNNSKKQKPLNGIDENTIAMPIIKQPARPAVQAKSSVVDPDSLAYKLKQRENTVHEYYNIPDKDFSAFLGKIEKKEKESVVITIAGGEGSMKTRLCFQLMNCFGQNYKIGHVSGEEHPESALYTNKALQYLNEKAQCNIQNPEIKSMDQMHKLIEENEVTVIDSYSKLLEMQRDFGLDKDLRKKYDGKLFIIIYQLTSDGKMRGGSASQFDGDIICHIEKNEDYKLNYCYQTKNRYSDKTGLQFNIFKGKLNQTEKPVIVQPIKTAPINHDYDFVV